MTVAVLVSVSVAVSIPISVVVEVLLLVVWIVVRVVVVLLLKLVPTAGGKKKDMQPLYASHEPPAACVSKSSAPSVGSSQVYDFPTMLPAKAPTVPSIMLPRTRHQYMLSVPHVPHTYLWAPG